MKNAIIFDIDGTIAEMSILRNGRDPELVSPGDR
jgi:hypothetical protein